ncbi:MAG: hypothetical protein WKF97_23015 [Chitinophagaceae bacterium]
MNDAKFSLDGKLIASVDDAGRMIVRETRSDRTLFNVQAGIGILMKVDISEDNRYFITAGMLLNEISVIDHFGNKIQGESFDEAPSNVQFIGKDKFVVAINVFRTYKMFLLEGFIKSGRIISAEKARLLEEGMTQFSIPKKVENQLMLHLWLNLPT